MVTTSPLTAVDGQQCVDVLICDGSIITVRPVQPGDRAALTARFVTGAGPATTATELDDLCRPDPHRLVDVAADGPDLIGVASCTRHCGDSTTATIAVRVAEAHRSRGIGTVLVEHLTARARHAGITRFLDDVRSSGSAMPGPGVTLIGSDAVQQAVQARDRAGWQPTRRPLPAPRSVAVVGAIRGHGSTGFEVLRALRDYGFRGRLYPVNDSGRPVYGVPGFRSIADLPEPVDLLVIATPAAEVAETLREAGKNGAGSAVVLTGYPVTGDAGRTQRDLLRIAHEHGMRLIGPGSLGVLNTDPRVRLNASLSPARPAAGGLALAAQSSAVGIALLEHATRNGCGVADFVGLGDQLDVAVDDLITDWYSDSRVRAVAMCLETPDSHYAFARGARALSRRKPVLVVPGTTIGTGPTHDRDEELFAQAGVIHVASVDEMTDTARLLVDQPLPTGDRLGIVGNAGGLTRLAADSARALGFTVVPLSPALRRQLPGGAGNPVDLGVEATAPMIGETLGIVARSGEVDVVLVVIAGTRANVPAAIMRTLGRVLDDKAQPPLTTAVVLTGSADDIHRIGVRGTPVYRQPDRALRALARACRYAVWRREPLGRRPALGGLQPGRATTVIERARADSRGWVPRRAAADLMAAYGVTVLPASWAGTGMTAIAAAERVGYPVMLTCATGSATPCHLGHVRRGLTTAAAVRAAFEELTRSGCRSDQVLVQHQPSAPVELIASITDEPVFGAIVELGLADEHGARTGRRAAHLVPLTDLDAGRMCRSLPWPSSHTGQDAIPDVNPSAVEDLLLRLGRLAENHPEIAALELNPLHAGPNGIVAANLRLRLTTTGPQPGR
ncbi:GNAT family N-acetyltransferase [Actinoplanes palleronii]|uniref:GNAT family N-acetyltransferase n=1 Tax=Actinoplanes palleronii TaxID=113570 RepID=A0ABQ4BC39_9ACTN|nr:GNAT family N-acetyltransferase [Actinoplanes palleronii]